MLLRVGEYVIDTEEIKGITITDSAVLVDGYEDFWKINYKDKSEIQSVINWNTFNTLSRKELRQAIDIIILTCEHFINEKEQCRLCPLQNKRGCVLKEIPIEWRT